jgi:hypothetical protein
MNRLYGKSQLRTKALSRRTLPRTSVLWSGLIARREEERAFNCVIRNISEGGAEISPKQPVVLGEQLYLLVPRNQAGYLASVAWIKDGRAGLSFAQAWDVARGLPAELRFLGSRLAHAKLSQMLGLVQRGFSIEDAAADVGWTEDEVEQIGDDFPTDQGASLALLQTKRLLRK